MKILSLHCDYLKFKPLKKAIKDPQELNEEQKKEVVVEEPLGIFVAVEKTDENNLKKAIDELVLNVEDLLNKTKAKKVVLYPYAHLSSNLSNPGYALNVLEGAEGLLRHKKVDVYRAPFGYYKEFELKCKGHPLAELSREIKIGCEVEEKAEKVVEAEKPYDAKQLLRQISKSKLDTSKLKENDHRILGQKLDLFSFNEVAPGMVFWHNNGLIIYNNLINYWREVHKQEGYQEISTPQIMDTKLWKISGHWKLYQENMFLTSYEDRAFAVKPMSCQGGILIYKTKPRSYKEMPMRMAELGKVHRKELSGVLAGLLRVIQFTQDDAHLFCAPEQLGGEITRIIKMFRKMLDKFGFKYTFTISTRSEEKKDKYLGSDEIWKIAEKALSEGLKSLGIKYEIVPGEAKFYGPSLDVLIKDSLGREWQCSTLQVDFNNPERFEMEYIGQDNKSHRPIMLHHVVYGSLERFIGVLLEHTNGNLPTWLSPVQVRVISFTDRNQKAAEKVLATLKEAGIRADADFSSGTVNEKVRNSELMKVPYLITIGDKEEEKKTIALKKRGEKEKPKFGVKLDAFIKEISEEIKERK